MRSQPAFGAALKPANAIEEIYVDDAIFHAWEVRRWRRAKGGLLLASSPAAMARLLGRVAVKPLATTLADGWAKGEPTAVAKVEALMESAGFTYDVAMGEAMAAKIDVLAGFDHLMAAAEGRFTTASRSSSATARVRPRRCATLSMRSLRTSQGRSTGRATPMVIEARAQANRANAQRSTGPTSAAGKARAAQNARQHGLSLDILADPALGQEVEDLAQRIAHEADRPDLIDLARRVAKAQMDVQRIREFCHRRMQAAVAALDGGSGGAARQRVPGADELAAALGPLEARARQILYAAHDAFNRRDIESLLDLYVDDLTYWSNFGGPAGGPLTITDKPSLRTFVSGFAQLESL